MSQPSFRHSMQWLHTWAGLVLGTLLFAIFWMGTLSVFDRELDRWMMPEIRFNAPRIWSADDTLLPAVASLNRQHKIVQWGATLADERRPFIQLFYRTETGEFHHARVDSRTGDILDDSRTLGASGFIFPFHYSLHLGWKSLGLWVVGLAAMAMLALLVSGVVIHRKFFRELFTFRPRKSFSRSTLDLHNLSSVAFLPFHFLITLSGLIIFIGIYFPGSANLVYGQASSPLAAYFADAGDGYSRPPSGEPASKVASLDAMLLHAESVWDDRAGFIRVFNYQDSTSFVQLGRSVHREVGWNIDKLFYDGVSGELLKESRISPLMNLQRFFVGLHFIQYEHWLLRWLYFIAGLAGCVMIATGFVFWLESRRKRHLRVNSRGRVLVEALSTGSTLGLLLATAAFFLANRVLPTDSSFGNWGRPELEVAVFAAVWVASFLLAVWLRNAAVRVQCLCLALLAMLAVIANRLAISPEEAECGVAYWSVMGTDMALMLMAAFSLGVFTWLRRSSAAGEEKLQ